MKIINKHQQFLVDENGKTKGIFLPVTVYRRLIRLLEDKQDATILKRAIRTSRETVPHTEFITHLKREGLL